MEAAALTLEQSAGDFIRIGTAVLQIILVTLVFSARWYLRRRKRRHGLNPEQSLQERNVFIYASEILLTSVGFAITCPAYHAIFRDPSRLTFDTERTCVAVALGLLGGMYSFEIVWKPRLGMPLAFHHSSTVLIGVFFAVFLAQLVKDNLLDAGAALLASVFLMSLTEQPIFIGLLLRRFGHHRAASWNFLFSSFHTLVVKMAIGGYTLVKFTQIGVERYPTCQHAASRVFLVLIPPIFVLLMVAQVYIARIYIALYRSSLHKANGLKKSMADPRSTENKAAESGAAENGEHRLDSIAVDVRAQPSPPNHREPAGSGSVSTTAAPDHGGADAAGAQHTNPLVSAQDNGQPPAQQASGTATRSDTSAKQHARTDHPTGKVSTTPQSSALRPPSLLLVRTDTSVRNVLASPALLGVRRLLFTPVPGLDPEARATPSSNTAAGERANTATSAAAMTPSQHPSRRRFFDDVDAPQALPDGRPCITLDDEDVAIGLESGSNPAETLNSTEYAGSPPGYDTQQ